MIKKAKTCNVHMLLPVEMFLFANISYDIVIHITPSMTKNMLNKVDTYHVMERIKFIATTCKKTIFPRQGRYIKFSPTQADNKQKATAASW